MLCRRLSRRSLLSPRGSLITIAPCPGPSCRLRAVAAAPHHSHTRGARYNLSLCTALSPHPFQAPSNGLIASAQTAWKPPRETPAPAAVLQCRFLSRLPASSSRTLVRRVTSTCPSLIAPSLLSFLESPLLAAGRPACGPISAPTVALSDIRSTACRLAPSSRGEDTKTDSIQLTEYCPFRAVTPKSGLINGPLLNGPLLYPPLPSPTIHDVLARG